ncbi:MAG: hypothetical protein ACLFRG_22625 [Desulfococcaceae bacterium]
MNWKTGRMGLALLLALCVAGCGGSDSDPVADPSPAPTVPAGLKSTVLQNDTAYIPPQCYTETVNAEREVHNSCYTCHTSGFRPDFVAEDDDLQLEYAFPAAALTNPWKNMFRDKTAAVNAIADAEIQNYIRRSNYFTAEGNIALAEALENVPEEWDYDEDGVWSGYVPDCYFNFDDSGFDRDPAGAYTGWRAFAYYPFPSTHWPANGGMSDVIIRLPAAFRTQNGAFDRAAYALNLAILESLIKRRDVAIPETDEAVWGVDLDRDGAIGTATRVTYRWNPLENQNMEYVGDARAMQAEGEVRMAAGLFPEGTEFLQTLRYIDAAEDGGLKMSARLKEIRHMKKTKWLTYAELEDLALEDVKERDDFPDRTELPIGNIEDGIGNGIGWRMRGFIEAANGDLRPQTFEETASCIGCHGGVGATSDGTYAFARKLPTGSHADGWFHWSQKGMEGINEPKLEIERGGVQYEYCFYLIYNGAGDEFRANEEIIANFLDADGKLKPEMAQALHEDISLLLHPSPERAMMLNKVYKTIVEEQSYIEGREPILTKAEHVYEEITLADEMTLIEEAVNPADWPDEIGWRPTVETPDDPVDPVLRAQVIGDGMGGPSGEQYEMDWEGLLDESRYQLDVDDFYLPFPPRHTLPVRMVVPLSDIPVCYNCHRIVGTVPADNPQVTFPVALPATDMTEPGANMARLTTDPGTDKNAEWSPDGSRIAWVSDRSGSWQIWVMNADGSNQTQLTMGPAIHGWPMWSPDGSRLVYWGHNETSGVSTIETIAPDGTDNVIVVESDNALDRPMWRPDGQYIAYAAAGENWDVWITRPDGTGKTRLTTSTDMDTNPLWNPDGTAISYKDAPAAGRYNLTIQNFITFENGMENPTIRRWDGIKSIQMYDWSPDGTHISYTAEIVTNASGEDRVSYLAVVEDVYPDEEDPSGTPVVLSRNNTLGDRGPVFSPDSQRVAFWSWDKNYRATLWMANRDGTNITQLTQKGFDMYPRWRPDGTGLLFESNRAGNMDIWTMELP